MLGSSLAPASRRGGTVPTQLTPSTPPRQTGPRNGRRALVVLGVLAVVAGLLGAYLLGRGTDDPATAPAPAPTITQTAAADVQLRSVAGVLLPFSATHGPRITSDGRAAGYSRSELGAAIAAIQVLARTSPSAGSDLFDPVLASQVTGTNLAAMKLAVSDSYQQLRATTSVPDGEPVPGNDATVSGYVVRSYGDTAASVDVVLASSTLSSSGQFVSFAVSLIWQSDDWRVIAPPNGDWGSVSTTLGALPPGLQRYEL
jgi:hypothetical protein